MHLRELAPPTDIIISGAVFLCIQFWSIFTPSSLVCSFLLTRRSNESMKPYPMGGGLVEEQQLPPDAVEALEDVAPCSVLLHSASKAAIAHARAYFKKEGVTNPWLYADLVRNKALGYLTEHAAEHGIGVEQLPNAGIRLAVKHRYFWVRKAGNE